MTWPAWVVRLGVDLLGIVISAWHRLHRARFPASDSGASNFASQLGQLKLKFIDPVAPLHLSKFVECLDSLDAEPGSWLATTY